MPPSNRIAVGDPRRWVTLADPEGTSSASGDGGRGGPADGSRTIG
jgi:hypothetical protein